MTCECCSPQQPLGRSPSLPCSEQVVSPPNSTPLYESSTLAAQAAGAGGGVQCAKALAITIDTVWNNI